MIKNKKLEDIRNKVKFTISYHSDRLELSDTDRNEGKNLLTMICDSAIIYLHLLLSKYLPRVFLAKSKKKSVP